MGYRKWDMESGKCDIGSGIWEVGFVKCDLESGI